LSVDIVAFCRDRFFDRARVRLRLFSVGLLFIDDRCVCATHCETLNSDGFELSRPKKHHQSKKKHAYRDFHEEEEEEEKSRILASSLAQQRSILFALPVFFFLPLLSFAFWI